MWYNFFCQNAKRIYTIRILYTIRSLTANIFASEFASSELGSGIVEAGGGETGKGGTCRTKQIRSKHTQNIVLHLITQNIVHRTKSKSKY